MAMTRITRSLALDSRLWALVNSQFPTPNTQFERTTRWELEVGSWELELKHEGAGPSQGTRPELPTVNCEL
jgi:hypothetical protein